MVLKMNKTQNDKSSSYSFFVLIIFFGLLFITLDSFLIFFQSSGSSSFLSFLGPNQDKILRGILSICVFVIFGSHVRYTMERQRELEESQRQYVDALLESDIKYKDILESIDEAYYEVTLEGKLIVWNNSLVKILGTTQDEIKKMDLRQFFIDYDNKQIIHAFQKTLKTGVPNKDIVVEFKRADGSIRFVDFAIALTKDPKGKITGFMGIVRDITSKKKVESLQQAKNAAEMASKTKSEFLANMSHEIRTPLNGVVGMLNLIGGTKLNAEQRDYVDTAFISVESLLDVINDILDFSKIEAGKLELEERSFNLENEINRLIMVFASKADEKEIELIVRYDPQAPRFVFGDQIRIRQILNNLISNSLKFTQKGHVWINIDCINIGEKAATFEISVQDTGIGITKEQQATIFDAFTQADTTTTRRFGGTGLGLSICKQLVKLMGGKIELESVPEKGTTFKFTLNWPIDKNGGAEIIDYSALLKEYVIVVDDNRINRKIFSEYLKTWNIRHDVFPMAMEAYEAMENAFQKQDPYTLLITDHLMPDMDGEELGTKVKSNTNLRSTTMVVISSSGGKSSIENFEGIGFSGYLNKPLNMSDFFNLLQTVIVQREGPIIGSRNSTSQLNLDKYEIEVIKGAKDKNILLAEDNKINQKASLAILKKLGFFNVTLAENGQQAFEMICKNSYDFVLMDVQMPIMDGYEATIKVREMEIENNQRRVPIIAQTANAMKGDKEICLKAGMDDYISKPIDKKNLIKVIHRWIDSKKDDKVVEHSEFEIRENEIAKNSHPIFDYKNALSRYSDDHEILREIVHAFLEECPEDFESIKTGITEQNTSLVAKAAHAVKGSASYVGAEKLKELAYKIETIAKSGDLSNAEIMVDTLLEEFLLFKKTIETFPWDGQKG